MDSDLTFQLLVTVQKINTTLSHKKDFILAFELLHHTRFKFHTSICGLYPFYEITSA